MKYFIRKKCPDFISPALMPDGKLAQTFRLSEYFAGHYGVIFFFPLDFNYISFTELLSIQERIKEFVAFNVRIVGISCDSYLGHRTWQLMPRTLGGLGTLAFPLISDMTRNVCRLFDVLVADAMPEAATLIVDPENNVVFQLRHDTSVGRNIDRTLEAIKTFQDSSRARTAPAEQIMLVEQIAPKLYELGYNIVGQSVDTDLNHPQWNMLPRDTQGRPKLSFPFLSCEQDWPKENKMTIAVRESLISHSTGLLMPDGQLLFEYHADRQIPRDFTELLRIADAVKNHFKTGQVIPWEAPS